MIARPTPKARNRCKKRFRTEHVGAEESPAKAVFQGRLGFLKTQLASRSALEVVILEGRTFTRQK